MMHESRRSVDKRRSTVFVPMPPEPVFCTENERCRGCPYPTPRHRLLAPGRDLFADRCGGNRAEAEVMNGSQSSHMEMGGVM